MSHGLRILVVLAIAMALLAPVTVAQKPPAPPPQPPPSAPPSRPATSTVPNQPKGDLMMFLRGRVATNDGTPLPNNVLVERVCNNRVRQQLYASPHGDFSMQLGSRADSFVDASGDPGPQSGAARKDSDMGIPRRDLANCELRASASGFYPSVMNLVGDLVTLGGSVDVGAIVVQRAAKIEGTTLSATPYKAPRDARRAYEKGLEAENWTEVLKLTGHILDLDPFNQQAAAGYMLDLDPLDYTEAYFYNGVANYKLNKIEDAEKSALRAEHLDLRTHFPHTHLLLAEISARKNNYAMAILEMQTYLELAPHATDADQVRERLAKLQKL